MEDDARKTTSCLEFLQYCSSYVLVRYGEEWIYDVGCANRFFVCYMKVKQRLQEYLFIERQLDKSGVLGGKMLIRTSPGF